jgi:hypothetical protein
MCKNLPVFPIFCKKLNLFLSICINLRLISILVLNVEFPRSDNPPPLWQCRSLHYKQLLYNERSGGRKQYREASARTAVQLTIIYSLHIRYPFIQPPVLLGRIRVNCLVFLRFSAFRSQLTIRK